jgi:ABC-2 type transport system permease protein
VTRIFLLELRNELWKQLRMPSYVLPALGFPCMFYLLFGILLQPPGSGGGGRMASYLLATYGVFGVLGAALFGLGAGVAIERGQGWLTVRRAMPTRPALHLGARLVVASLFGLTIAVGLAALAATLGGVRLPTASWALLLFTVAACALPFGAIGLIFGNWLGPNSAVGVINLVYLPMSFLSGLWIPINVLPGFLRELAPFWPSYHASQLTLAIVGAPTSSSVGRSVAVLAVVTVVAFVVAGLAARRSRVETWG